MCVCVRERERESVCVCCVHSKEEFPAELYNHDASVLRQIAATFSQPFPGKLEFLRKKTTTGVYLNFESTRLLDPDSSVKFGVFTSIFYEHFCCIHVSRAKFSVCILLVK